MPWTITWLDLSREEQASYLQPCIERTQKIDEERACCLCPRPVVDGDKYKQHAGHRDRIAHSKCVSKYFTGEAYKPVPRKPEVRRYTAQELERAKAAAYKNGYKAGQDAILGENKVMSKSKPKSKSGRTA